jgi:hypothetical protein
MWAGLHPCPGCRETPLATHDLFLAAVQQQLQGRALAYLRGAFANCVRPQQ